MNDKNKTVTIQRECSQLHVLKDKIVLIKSFCMSIVTGEEGRNRSRKNEEAKPKQKQHPAVDITGDESKV